MGQISPIWEHQLPWGRLRELPHSFQPYFGMSKLVIEPDAACDASLDELL
jgi:hypothetical protein